MGLTPWDDLQRRTRNLERAVFGLATICDEYMPAEGQRAVQKLMSDLMFSTGASPDDFRPPFEPPN